MMLLRADCEDIWQQLALDGVQLARHYLLYPNPWPKAKHLQRRVHGQAVLPALLQLGGVITLRSNWQLYVEEFGLALHLAIIALCVLASSLLVASVARLSTRRRLAVPA